MSRDCVDGKCGRRRDTYEPNAQNVLLQGEAEAGALVQARMGCWEKGASKRVIRRGSRDTGQ